MQNHSHIYMSFPSHANKTYIHIKVLHTWPRFEKKANSKSEMGSWLAAGLNDKIVCTEILSVYTPN